MVMTHQLDLVLNVILFAAHIGIVAIGLYLYKYHPNDEDE